MRRSAGSEAGFTLIELMIVVAIIGILAMIAIPNFLRAMNQAKFTNCLQSMSGLKVAEEMYITDNSTYAPSGTGAAGLARLAMYMMPGCTAENSVALVCGGGLATRLRRNCPNAAGTGTSITLVSMASGYDYEILGTAGDRFKAKICMGPKGVLPISYKTVTPSGPAMTCP
jgi:prepilin-type N-terminal cleavage/methylation domain-containing protein